MGRGRFAAVLAVGATGLATLVMPAQPAHAAVDYATVVKYAPEFRFSTHESYWPQNPNVYVTQTRLKFSRNNLSDPTIAEIASPANIGASTTSPYTYSYKNKTWTTKLHTRPYDSGRDALLDNNEGFFLELTSSSYRTGRVPTDSTCCLVRVHYQITANSSSTTAITYWVFYAYNKPYQAGSYTGYDHEGDWEGLKVIVRNSDNVPISVIYHAHDCTLGTVWNTDTPKNGTHPVAWVGAGSHAAYPYVQNGRPDRCDGAYPALANDYVDNSGRRWQTWVNTNYLVSATAQNYYGYGRAWEVVGSGGGTTGPLGISAWKKA